MIVRVAELRLAANTIFDHLEKSGHEEVDLEMDYYWSIPAEKLYAVYEEPSNFTIGQLSEDVQEIRQIISGKKMPVAYALVWLSSLLRAVGAKIIS